MGDFESYNLPCNTTDLPGYVPAGETSPMQVSSLIGTPIGTRSYNGTMQAPIGYYLANRYGVFGTPCQSEVRKFIFERLVQDFQLQRDRW